MKLTSFQVWDYRSINESGAVDIARITALLGRNESGKTNLLRALESLNPPGGIKELSKIKDFPRHRRLQECTNETKVLETTWRLDSAEQKDLAEIFPRAKNVTEVRIGRYYAARRYVSFEKLPPLSFDAKGVAAKVKKIKPHVVAAAGRLPDSEKAKALEQAAAAFETAMSSEQLATKWGPAAVKALAVLRQSLANAQERVPDEENALIASLEELAETTAGDEAAYTKAREWAAKKLPVFIFLDEYPELLGHQNISDFIKTVSIHHP